MKTTPGLPSPFGATHKDGAVNFAVYAEGAAALELCLFDAQGRETKRIAMSDGGNIWHVAVLSDLSDSLYCYAVRRGETVQYASDPYARELTAIATPARLAALRTQNFEWNGDRRPQIGENAAVIYEAHVKGFTRLNENLPAEIRGKYAGIAHPATIGYLKSLGITTLELLPVFAKSIDPFLEAKELTNYWGYNTLGYFAPESEYAITDPVAEFKVMVRELHRAGIEVILDVVYNHTGEGNAAAAAQSFRALAEKAYYRTSETGEYVDYTHCGNTLNSEHEIVRRLILDSMRYWANEMHIDGFRFDLAPTLFRKGASVTFDHELHRAILQDPVLSQLKLIVEPWDLGPHGYQRGHFPPPYVEWNDRFRDTAREFWKGLRPADDLATLMLAHSHRAINFVTCHDGFTLRDLVSYQHKRNEANKEDNKDGSNHNHSFNCGHEGETEDAAVNALRLTQSKNLMATLLLAQEMPMLLAGDEAGNSQQGNNNAYCQDNEISWLSWTNDAADLGDFVRKCIALRPALTGVVHPQIIRPPSGNYHAFGLLLGKYIVLMNSSAGNVLFALPDTRMREFLRSDREIRSDELRGVYLLPARCVAVLKQVNGG